MIAAYFYPKELKEAISNLVRQHDLNLEALKELNYQINIRVIAMPLLAILFLFVLDGYVAWVVACILIVGLWIDVHNYYKGFIGAYLFGERREAVVVKQVSMTYFRKKIIAQDANSQKIVKIGPLREFWKNPLCPKLDETVFYYQDEAKRYKAMPDLEFVKQKYALSDEILKGVKR